VGYVGRFAPSPTGPLHLGSLVAAAAGYLHAKQASGEWLVRIEDIDPPREAPGAADSILRTLEAFELHWDRSALFQSRRRSEHEAAVARLLETGRAFRCSCSRSSLSKTAGGPTRRYPGTCRGKTRHERATAVRVRVDPGRLERFVDGLQGEIAADLAATLGDYVVWRRDDLPAYHLAVVLDDAAQGVTTVVRGVDLLDSTAAHLHLQRTLGLPAPRYVHLPVVENVAGQKLSKQTGAAPVATEAASAIARQVLGLLGLSVPSELAGAPPGMLWHWAAERWDVTRLQGRRAWRDPGIAPTHGDR
jgi:glutamyl-Q tRNA(Asp) synthetase